MGKVIVTRALGFSGQVVVQLLKRLVNYLYMPDDGRDQKHKEFCVICGLIIIAIGVPAIIAFGQ